MVVFWHQRRLADSSPRRDDHRSPYQRDRARILHSAAFRRLQAKTQVLGVGMNDFYRTRLTHSLEVSQIGTGICGQLKLKYPELNPLLDSMNLIESICLAHDIGHPPFGHGGEVALNYMMRDHGGFEGNGQTFRILTQLEPYTEKYGMNLCRRTLLGVLKYPICRQQIYQKPSLPEVRSYRQLKPSEWSPIKAIFDEDNNILNWVLAPLSSEDKTLFLTTHKQDAHALARPLYKSFDCSIMELADDIAYAIHDLEDAIVMGIVTQAMWQQDVAHELVNSDDHWIKQELGNIGDNIFALEHHKRKDAIGTLVNSLVTAIIVDKQQGFEEPLLAYNATLTKPFRHLLNVLKQFVFHRVIRKPEIQILEYKGQQIVMELFEAFSSDPQRLLPINTQQRWQNAVNNSANSQRIIADYISGMTDEFAAKLHQQLFSARADSLKTVDY